MRNFLIKSKTIENVGVLYPTGHLDAHSVEKFENEMIKMLDDSIVKIVVNCNELNYISSAGMGIIMGYLDEIREKGGDIKLSNVIDRVYEIFDLVGFTEIYEFVDSEEKAIEKFNNVS
ncbi:MAG: STAS domain-containing protein [Candidatus Aminicenantes bacterium]|nr:STAS domain-containing protein [Candidatus Aminicenantes bacterium]